MEFIRRRVTRRSRQLVNVKGSSVARPDLVNATATITDSELKGDVVVYDSAKIIRSRLRGAIIVGDHSKIVDAQISGNVSVGRWTTFNGPNSDIYTSIESLRIGNFCSIARNVSIQEYDHIIDRATSYFINTNFFGEDIRNDVCSKGEILIGNDVWIGTQSVVLSGATISDGAVIGANTVVTSYVPPYAIVTGSPARIVRYRFGSEIVERLMRLRWWQWDDDVIKAHREFFNQPITASGLDKLLEDVR